MSLLEGGYIDVGFQIESMAIEDDELVVRGQGMERRITGEELKENELIQAYRKIHETFDDFTQLMRARIPYKEWPEHLQIAGINEDLLGPADKKEEKMSGECDECGEHALECICNAVMKRIQDMGRAQEKLKTILDSDIFGKAAFDPYWTHDNEDFDNRLDEIRLRIAVLEDNLWDVWAVLRDKDA